jgi:hypothetical protein
VWCSASVFALSRSLLTCTVREIFRNCHVQQFQKNALRMILIIFWACTSIIKCIPTLPKNLDSLLFSLANFSFVFSMLSEDEGADSQAVDDCGPTPASALRQKRPQQG